MQARFAQFVLLLHWATCGVPLLVREALVAALQQQELHQAGNGRSWSELCAAAMRLRFTKEESMVIRRLKSGTKKRMDCVALDRLDPAEKRHLLWQSILGIPIQLSAVRDVSAALVKARIYTTCAEADKDCKSLTSWKA